MSPLSSLGSLLLLVVTCLSYGVFCSNIDYRRPIKIHITCCTKVSKAQIKFPITEYKIQHAANRCVYAVIFRTKANGSFCADPKVTWVQKKVKQMSGGTEQLPTIRKGNKGTKGRKGGRKQNKKNKNKTKNKNTKPPVTSPWFPSTAATTVQTMS